MYNNKKMFSSYVNMFWRKKQKIDLVFVVFGLIAFFILASFIVILTVFLLKIDGKFSLFAPAVLIQTDYVEPSDKFVEAMKEDIGLENNYQKEIRSLYNYVKETNGLDKEKVFEEVERSFFSVKVPKDYLDVHLYGFREIQSIKDKSNNFNTEYLKQKILQVLSKIIKEF